MKRAAKIVKQIQIVIFVPVATTPNLPSRSICLLGQLSQSLIEVDLQLLTGRYRKLIRWSEKHTQLTSDSIRGSSEDPHHRSLCSRIPSTDIELDAQLAQKGRNIGPSCERFSEICNDLRAELLHRGSPMREQPGVLAVHLIAPARTGRLWIQK